MRKVFETPALGDSVAEVEIAEWLIEIGAPVAVDEEVVAVETDKSTLEVPSPWAGTLAERFAEVGDVVEVGKPLFAVDVPDA
jgi:pyruvate dehydrogenase E2 component (dihydrolipoamide acetyltransferase)